MDAPLSPNPARNPAFKPGEGKYDKKFLLSFRHVFTKPPAELYDSLRRIGLTSAFVTRPFATPPRHNVPFIAVTPPAETEHEQTTASDAAKVLRMEPIAFIRKRTDVRLSAREAALKQQEEDLDRRQAEVEKQKRDLDEERAQLYRHCISVQHDLNDSFQNLFNEIENLERARLETMAQTLTEKAQIADAMKACADQETEAWISKNQSKKMRDSAVAITKRLLAFFQVLDNISEELRQRIVAALEAELIALDGQDFSSPGTQYGRTSQSRLPTSNFVVPRITANDLILITGIPRGSEQDEVARAVGSLSGNTIRVHSLLPGSPTMISLAYSMGNPDRFFEGNSYIVKDSEMRSIGRVRLHFVRVKDQNGSDKN
ncbi:hypothetical protein SLS58_002630 [Diplodia intermedia]|uniref:Uncharacterized protein n=1 Tax=Diplodia intermedia TaxID=856260 RepID=A0ABR3TZ43_9PEZI